MNKAAALAVEALKLTEMNCVIFTDAARIHEIPTQTTMYVTLYLGFLIYSVFDFGRGVWTN